MSYKILEHKKHFHYVAHAMLPFSSREVTEYACRLAREYHGYDRYHCHTHSVTYKQLRDTSERWQTFTTASYSGYHRVSKRKLLIDPCQQLTLSCAPSCTYQINNLHLPQANLAVYQKRANYSEPEFLKVFLLKLRIFQINLRNENCIKTLFVFTLFVCSG